MKYCAEPVNLRAEQIVIPIEPFILNENSINYLQQRQDNTPHKILLSEI